MNPTKYSYCSDLFSINHKVNSKGLWCAEFGESLWHLAQSKIPFFVSNIK
jgi:hypothetical protein